MSIATKAPPPPKRKNGAPPPAAQVSNRSFAVTSGKLDTPERIVLFGPGGIGKTTLAALAPNAVIVDIEHGSAHLDVQRINGIESWAELRQLLQSDALDGFETIVIDSSTKAEELATEHTLKTVKTDKGMVADNIESYGFGKGYQHRYDTFLLLLADLDASIRKGRNVILVAHDCIENVPNPVGDDWIRYEPALYTSRSGKASIRNRVFQWADHVLFVGYDVVTGKDGKGRGTGTRTIYPAELPTHRAKSRTLPDDPIPFTGPDDDTVWRLICGGAR